jgi:hypothetical protein
MARPLHQIVQERLGALEWDLLVLMAELDKVREVLAAAQAALLKATVKKEPES